MHDLLQTRERNLRETRKEEESEGEDERRRKKVAGSYY